METWIGLMMGVGLAAACGFRVFVPLLGLSLAGMSGYVSLAPSMLWLATWPALTVLATATVLEVAAYYVPWVDNLLDTIATPLAVAAGTLATGTQLGELSPVMQWSLAAITGGGVSAVVQTGTVALRSVSTGLTAGMGNVLLSTGELLGAVTTTVLAILLPVVAFVLVLFLLVWLIRRGVQQRRVAIGTAVQ